MKNKIFASIIIYIVCSTVVYAQKLQIRVAERHYNNYEFASAVDIYEKIATKENSNKFVMERLVDCYKKLNDPERSAKWLSRLVELDEVDFKYYQWYAEALASHSRYAEAVLFLEKYNKSASDQRVSHLIEKYKNIHTFYRDSAFYKIEKVVFNSSQSDFSPMFYGDYLVFCSSRDKNSVFQDIFPWNKTIFIDLFLWKNDSLEVEVFNKDFNTRLHEGPLTFNVAQDTIYFTRNSYYKNKRQNSSDGINKLNIYYATLKNGKWSKEKPFEFNNPEYSMGHPALNKEGELFFVSDMPGGYGGTDIYYTKRVDGKWIDPINLGPEINTSKNEMFPFVDDEGNLYFASDGHPGLGGLDLFVSKKNMDKYRSPKNLGYPLNSPKDDFGLIVRSSAGYFSSNRGEVSDDDNIFRFRIDRTKPIIIAAIDDKGQILHDFSLSVLDSIGNYRIAEVVKDPGTRPFTLEYEAQYEMAASKKGYTSNNFTFTKELFWEIIPHDTLKIMLKELPKEKRIKVDLIDEKKKRIDDGIVEIKDMLTMDVKRHTFTKKSMLDVVLLTSAGKEIRGSKKGYETKAVRYTEQDLDSLKDGTVVVIQLTPSILFDSDAVGELVELNIMYDYNKHNIRPDAARELDKLVEYLKRYTKVKVELGSHTDARGRAEYNLTLSQKRAESAAEYVISKGIDPSRIISLGYGKEDLKIKDAKTEKEHQQNRRTTVKILEN